MKSNRTIATQLTRIALLVALSSVACARQAWPWGCEGHETVALIAEKHLNANALQHVTDLLKNNPTDPHLHRLCKNGGADLMADASTWADDERDVRKDTAPWHFLDIPRGTPQTKAADFCPSTTGCVTSALNDQINVLKAGGSNQQTADALRFVIHFVGDLHQPLHCTTNNDRGGNCVPVAFFARNPRITDSQKESYSPNLHAVWETDIVKKTAGQATRAEDV